MENITIKDTIVICLSISVIGLLLINFILTDKLENINSLAIQAECAEYNQLTGCLEYKTKGK